MFCLPKISDKLKIINVILEHIYGPYDSDSKFVENMIQNIAVQIFDKLSLTKGYQKRDLLC